MSPCAPRSPHSPIATLPLTLQWNYIDFVVVIAGFFTLIPGIGNASALRIIRVLRPLRTLNRLKRLRVLVETLLKSMGQLFNVAVLILFLFTIYSIVGLQVCVGGG